MLTINKYPPALVLSLNDVEIEVNSDNQVETSGSLASLLITMTTKPSTGNKIVLTGFLYLEFTASASPDDSGLQFSSSPATITLALAELKSTFEANYLVSKYYDVTTGTGTITLTAKQTGSLYNIDLGTSYSGVTGTDTSGTDKVNREFFGILAQTYWRNVGDTAWNIFEEVYDVDNNGDVEFNISGFMQDVSDSFQFPVVDILTDRSTSLIEGMVKLAESWGLPRQVRKLVVCDSFKALPGQVNKAIVNWLESKEISWASLVKMQKSWLTVFPTSMVAGKNQNLKFYIVTTETSVQEVNLIANIYYHDGTSNLNLKLSSISALLYSLLEVDIDLSTINANGDINYIELFYQQVLDESSLDSSLLTINLDYKNYTHERTFIFRNSLGVFNAMRTTGDSVLEGEIDADFINVDLYEGERKRTRIKKLNQVVNTITASTGWVDADMLPAIVDFLSSSEVYEIEGNRLLAVDITTNKLKLDNDLNVRYNIEFDYEKVDNTTVLPSLEGEFSFAFSNAFKII